MAKDQRKRQQIRQRQAEKRRKKEKTQRAVTVQSASPRAIIRAAARWPVHECLVPRNWDAGGELLQVVVARRSLNNRIAAAVFLVDLGVLGVKNAFTRLFEFVSDYELGLRDHVMRTQPLISVDLNLAAKIVREAIAYAQQFGFSPHRDYYEAAHLLEGADPDACPEQIPLGKDGKPFYVAGPYDNADRIMAQLLRAVGPSGFTYLVPLGDAPDLLAPDEWEEEDEDEDDEENPDELDAPPPAR